jgi:hypothetical protein
VNVSYLLVTTAWLAGAEPAPAALQDAKDKTAKPVVVQGSGHGHDCCPTECCNDSWRHRLRDRCRGLLSRRNDCCDPCPRPCPQPCPQPCPPVKCCVPCPKPCPPPCPAPCPPTNCCERERHRLFQHRSSSSCCEPQPCCERRSFLDRCRGLLRRDRGCCEPDPCCHTGTAPKGEVIPAPKDKKMPKGTEPTLQNGVVPQIPFNTPALQTPPISPTIPGTLERRERDF